MKAFNKIIHERRSIRKFKKQTVENTLIQQLIKAALLAPSGKGMYPCEFLIIDHPETLQALSKAKAHGAALLANAPLAIAVVADTSKYDVWVEDASIASTFIMLEAENLGLGCCWVQMRLRGTTNGKSGTDNLREILNLQSQHEILSVLAIGYKDEEKSARTDSDLLYEKIHHNRLHNKPVNF
jgi:nitroreductase